MVCRHVPRDTGDSQHVLIPKAVRTTFGEWLGTSSREQGATFPGVARIAGGALLGHRQRLAASPARHHQLHARRDRPGRRGQQPVLDVQRQARSWPGSGRRRSSRRRRSGRSRPTSTSWSSPTMGAPSGSGNYQQGDPGFGDIRIGGYNFGNSTLAAGLSAAAGQQLLDRRRHHCSTRRRPSTSARPTTCSPWPPTSSAMPSASTIPPPRRPR